MRRAMTLLDAWARGCAGSKLPLSPLTAPPWAPPEMKMPIGKCLSVLLLFLVAAPLSGQTTGAVLGRVTDPSGAVVPSARVEIVSEQTALSTSTTAGPRGD